MNSLIACLFLATHLPLTGIQDVEGERLPVPDPDSQKEAEDLIRDIFSEEYKKKTHADRLDLAKKLIRQAADAEDDAVTQFVLLREARDLAGRAGDGKTACDAINKMAVTFRIDAIAMKFSTLSEAGKRAGSVAKAGELAHLYLGLAEEAAEAEDYGNASKAAAAAQKHARRSKNIPLATRSKAKATEFSELSRFIAKVKSARSQLKTDPADPAAHFIVGRYLCLFRGKWEEGLPHLAQGDDATLKSLANRDIEAPTDGKSQAEVGDGWWDLAKKQRGIVLKNTRNRASFWYRLCLKELTGLSRIKVEKRLESLDGNWVDLTDAARFGLSGKRGEPFEIALDPRAENPDAAAVWLKKFPRGTFDGLSARLRFGPKRKAHGGLMFENDMRMVYIVSGNDSIIAAHFDRANPGWVADVEAKVPKRDEYEIKILLADGAYVVYVDGEEKLQIKADVSMFTSLALQVSAGPVRYDKIRLRKKEN